MVEYADDYSYVDKIEVDKDDDIKISLFDFILIMAWFFSILYILKLSLLNHQDFSLVGALFMTTMGTFFIKAFYEMLTVSIKASSNYLKTNRKFQFKTPSIFGLVNKRIEFSIRIVDKDRSKVKF